jgi:maltose O-acetyltransferase
MIRRALDKCVVHVVNMLCAVLPDDPISCRLRPRLLGLIGVSIAGGVRIRGGGRFEGGRIVIGQGCFINRGCYFDATGTIRLGHRVTVGHGAALITASHVADCAEARAGKVTARDVHVGDGVWIGANAIILPGVSIGAGSIVGAGAVVTRDVPANVLVAGNPAVFKKELAA